MQLGENDAHGSNGSADPPEVPPYSAAWESPFRMSAEGWARAIEAFGVDLKGPATSTPGGRVRARKASAAPVKNSRPGDSSNPSELSTAWAIALRELGRLGADLGDGRFALWCINDAMHSNPDGSAENAGGSCVLLPPLEDAPHGLPHCSHGHCADLRLDDWRAFVPADVWDRAVDAAKVVAPTEKPVTADAPTPPPVESIELDAAPVDPVAAVPATPPVPPPPAPAPRARIVISRRTVTRDDNNGVSGAVVDRTAVPDLARAGVAALSLTPWGERMFALEGSNPPCMVHVLPPGVADDGSPDTAPRARVVTTSRNILRGWLSGAARWVSEGAGKSGRETHESDPSDAVVSYVLESCDGLAHLRGIVESPVMRADGTIIEKPGYDPATKLYVAFDAEAAREALASIPARPTASDAKAAAAVLFDLVSNFPFEKDSHKSAWLAGLLTMFAREMFSGPAPLFLARANTRGSGKTLATELPHIIATGERPAMLGWSGDETEFEKMITAEAIAGSSCIVIDNITGLMKSATLDRILTSGKHRARILGGSQRFDGALRAVWWASGNNVETSDDMARRTAPIELVTKEERPEQRTGFAADVEGGDTGTAALRGKAKRERWRYVAAVLTILRAWWCGVEDGLVTAKTAKLPAWGSFESWSRVVRGAIVHAGCADPGEAQEDFRNAAASDVGHLRGLLEGWVHATRAGLLSPAGETLARVLKKLAKESEDGPAAGLREALEAVSGANLGQWRTEHSGRVGKFLRGNRRKVSRTAIGTFTLDVLGESGGSARWAALPAVDSAAEPGGIGGKGGISHTPHEPETGLTPEAYRDIPPNPLIPPHFSETETDDEWVEDPPGFGDVEGFE